MIDAAILGEMIPIIGVLSVGAIVIVRTVMKADIRKLELQLQLRQTGSVGDNTDAQALRDEVARLRDTSTQYDVSLQHAMERLEQRIAHLEKRTVNTPTEVKSDQPTQQTLSR